MNINSDGSINQLMHKLGKYQSLINHVDDKFNKQRYQMKINEYANKIRMIGGQRGGLTPGQITNIDAQVTEIVNRIKELSPAGLDTKYNNLVATHNELLKYLKTLGLEIDGLIQKLRDVTQREKECHDQIKLLEAQHATALGASQSSAASELQQAHAAVDDAKAKLSDLTSQFEDARSTNNTRAEKLGQLAAAAEVNLQKVQARLAQMEQEHAEEINTLKRQLIAADDVVKTARVDLVRAQGTNAANNAADAARLVRQSAEKLAEAEQTATALQTQLEALKSNNAATTIQRGFRGLTIKKLQIQINVLQTENARLTQELKTAETKITAITTDDSKCNDKIAQILAQINKAIGTVKDKEINIIPLQPGNIIELVDMLIRKIKGVISESTLSPYKLDKFKESSSKKSKKTDNFKRIIAGMNNPFPPPIMTNGIQESDNDYKNRVMGNIKYYATSSETLGNFITRLKGHITQLVKSRQLVQKRLDNSGELSLENFEEEPNAKKNALRDVRVVASQQQRGISQSSQRRLSSHRTPALTRRSPSPPRIKRQKSPRRKSTTINKGNILSKIPNIEQYTSVKQYLGDSMRTILQDPSFNINETDNVQDIIKAHIQSTIMKHIKDYIKNNNTKNKEDIKDIIISQPFVSSYISLDAKYRQIINNYIDRIYNLDHSTRVQTAAPTLGAAPQSSQHTADEVAAAKLRNQQRKDVLERLRTANPGKPDEELEQMQDYLNIRGGGAITEDNTTDTVDDNMSIQSDSKQDEINKVALSMEVKKLLDKINQDKSSMMEQPLQFQQSTIKTLPSVLSTSVPSTSSQSQLYKFTQPIDIDNEQVKQPTPMMSPMSSVKFSSKLRDTL
jgi:hypothetical protein